MNRIAFGACRWQVVTLTGELINLSGTMSGGASGAKPRGGGMSSKLQVATGSSDSELDEARRDRKSKIK